MVPANKIHDIHPPISPAGLYWTARLQPGQLTISSDGRSATLEVNDLAVIDEPTFPKPGSAAPATISFRIVWTALGSATMFNNADKHFALLAAPARARASFKVAVPSAAFTWESAPLETSTSSDALIGSEVNGRYYDQGVRPGLGAMPGLPNTGAGGGRRVFAMPGLGGAVAGAAGLAALAIRRRGREQRGERG